MHLLNSPNRRLISEGELTRVAPKEVLGKKLLLKTQGHYFLFSDLFLFTKPTSSSYDLRAQVPLTQALYKGTVAAVVFYPSLLLMWGARNRFGHCGGFVRAHTDRTEASILRCAVGGEEGGNEEGARGGHCFLP